MALYEFRKDGHTVNMLIPLSVFWTSQAIHAKCPYTSFCIALCLCLEQKLFDHQLAFA